MFDRNVYPTEEALDNLSIFDEELPLNSTKATNVIELLNQYGSPATTATLGGKYFGFVCGSAVPVGLAAKSLGTYWDQAPAMNVSQLATTASAVQTATTANIQHDPQLAEYQQLLQQQDAIIIAHYYTPPEIQQLTDETGGFIGDSLSMAKYGQQHCRR